MRPLDWPDKSASAHWAQKPQMQLVHAKHSSSFEGVRHPAQYICTGSVRSCETLVPAVVGLKTGEVSEGVVSEFGFMMWNWLPDESAELWWTCEILLLSDESTDAKGCRSASPGSGGGGVSARLRGEAWKDWNCEPIANPGGSDVRDGTSGDW